MNLQKLYDLWSKEIRARTYQNNRLYNMPIEEAIDSGEVIGPCTLDNGGEIRTRGFQFKLRKGDHVKICIVLNKTLHPLNTTNYTISNISYTAIGVANILLDMPPTILEQNAEIFLVNAYEPIFDWSFRKRIMSLSGIMPRKKLNVNVEDFHLQKLNAAQSSAILKVISNDFSGVIQGPPGTGKTEVLARLVEIAVYNKLKVGILSFTNKAVDNALNRISKTITDGVYRVGDNLKVNLNDGIQLSPTYSAITNFQIIGSTTHKFLGTSRRPHFDVIILDESSQIPSFFLPGLKHSCSNLVMIGDQQQLPPIMKGSNLKDCHIDCFSLYKEEFKELPMLEIQYRMNSIIQDWSSKRYYQGKLTAHESNANRDILSSSNSTILGDHVVKYDDIYRGSDHIASRVIDYAKEAKYIGNLSWDDIGIISPHRIHAAKINQKIQERLGIDVNNIICADTVDRFQGQEKELIILSVPEEYCASSSLLNDYRRINVAVTRAKSRFLVVSDYRIRHEEEFSDFLNWCSSTSLKALKLAV